MSSKTSLSFAESDRASDDDAAAYEDFALHASLSERVIITLAVAFALLFVTTVAVLMGMA
jgi:hypothetical protein